MDDIVRQAMAKWPNVPDCYGWLGLDARGNWYMRDDRVQAAGPFPASKGSLLKHEKLIDFIHRNYEADALGRWYFQNGPQRVYVTLEASPLVWGVRRATQVTPGTPVQAAYAWQAHTGLEAQTLRSAWLDEHGRLFIDTDAGFGLVRSLDMDVAADALEASGLTLSECRFDELPQRFGYQLHPQAQG